MAVYKTLQKIRQAVIALSSNPDYKDAKAPMHALLTTRSGSGGQQVAPNRKRQRRRLMLTARFTTDPGFR